MSYTYNPLSILEYNPLLTEKGEVFSLKMQRIFKERTLIVKLKGVETRDCAENYKGQQVFTPRSAFPEVQAGEFYHSDLIGLIVKNEEDKVIGTIVSVQNYGAGDFFEIKTLKGKFATLPFTEDAVGEINVAEKFIIINEIFLLI